MTKIIFPICSETRLSRLIGIPKAELRDLAENARNLYRAGELHLPGREPRQLDVPLPQLSTVQRRILEQVFVEFEPHECSFGGIKGRSAAQNAQRHLDNRFVIKVDVRKFYPNVHHRWVQAFFEKRLRCVPPVASNLRKLLTLNSGLPQGACTSPALADQILKPVDTRLCNALNARKIMYTRWVDDITLSAAFSMRTFVPFVDKLLRPYGLHIHNQGEKAPKQFGPGQYATVTGLTLSKGGISVADSYIDAVRRELETAERFRKGLSTEIPLYGKETYWGAIRYIARFDKTKAQELQRVFDKVAWEDLIPFNLPSKRGKVVYAEKCD